MRILLPGQSQQDARNGVARRQAPSKPEVSFALLVGQKLHRDRLEIVGQVKSEHLRIKGKLSFQRALHIRQLTKSMSLALENEIGVRNSLPPQRVDHLLGLGDWDHHVVGALKHDQRPAQPVDVVDRRALAI